MNCTSSSRDKTVLSRLEGVGHNLTCTYQSPGDVQNKEFKRLHYHRSQGDRSVVIKSCGPWLLGDGDDGGGFEAGWHMACLQ